ncbi:apolipoprotein N-acyltransferase [Algimonas porphyrae]|uniref:Apolipoprotein N-acyltransferase n=1 Tax=Algimonas porphyrae TaxID=1128113 RepID=A0ABQ5V109_9PROT|nr:apolipoprotein N-acyltransferase [Algimonas porphyrae]GLQ20772.1 apolipoprotein N-acyltransferase [Algimonas porphyrae]
MSERRRGVVAVPPLARRRGWLAGLAVTAIGAFAALGFAPFHIWGATLLSLSLLFVRLIGVSDGDRPVRAGFRTGLLFGLGWFSASCFWIASAFIQRGPEFIPMIPPLVGGLAILLSLFWGIAGALTVRFARGRSVWWAAGLFIATYMLAELARGHVLSGFPWNMAAYAFEPGGAISQSASLVGVYGLSLIAYGIAALFGIALLTRNAISAVGGVAILVVLFSFGQLRLASASTDIQPGVLLRLVDAPFHQSEKINPATTNQVIDNHIRASLAPGLEDVTHLVWPEGAVNGLAIEDERLLQIMGELLVRADDSPPVWLMNSLRMEISPDPRTGVAKSRYYNSAVAVTFDASGFPAIAATNDKAKLVPFGEFIPGGEIVEQIGARLVSTALGSITPAPEKRIAQFPGLPPISPQICYEVIFPGLTPRARNGRPAPQAILNQSNDAWFGATTGPHQHAAIARYRAIEEGLPLIRSAANGISGVFDPYGRADRVLSAEGIDHLDAVLPMAIGSTVSMRQVNAALLLINLCLFLLGAIGSRRS